MKYVIKTGSGSYHFKSSILPLIRQDGFIEFINASNKKCFVKFQYDETVIIEEI